MRRTQPQTTKLTPRTDTQTGTYHSASVDVADTLGCGNTTIVLVRGRENGGTPPLSDANIRNGGPQTRTRLASAVPPRGYVYGITRRREPAGRMWWKTKAQPAPPPHNATPPTPATPTAPPRARKTLAPPIRPATPDAPPRAESTTTNHPPATPTTPPRARPALTPPPQPATPISLLQRRVRRQNLSQLCNVTLRLNTVQRR